MGGGSIKRLIYTLADEAAMRKDTELIVICGSNKRMYDELKKQDLSGVTVVGFTLDMAEYMKAADLFVTKPGGLSSTEAAVCGIPLIHVAPIPGCETYNARFFSDYGMSRYCHTSDDELADALKILDSEAERDAMIRNQRKMIRSDAAGRISDLAERMTLSSQEASVMNVEICLQSNRKAITKTIVRLINEIGFANISMSKIAKAAGISAATCLTICRNIRMNFYS